MPLPGYRFRNPRDLLSAAEVDAIHGAALHILNHTGVVFASDSALRILAQGGCQVDAPSGRVRFAPPLVEECIAHCPSQVPIRARHPDYDLAIGDDRLYFQSHPGLHLLDMETDQRREATLADIGPLTRLVDAMDQIHLSIMPVGSVADGPAVAMIEAITAEQMRHTQKVIAAGVFQGCAPWIVEMAQVTGQQVYGQINPITPLTYPADQIEGGIEYVRAGHPVCILPGPTLGANSPATLAGTLVLQAAEHLAAVVLIQLCQPGASVTLGSYPHLIDMRSGSLSIGAVEMGLLGAAQAQLARRYGIPCHPQFPITDSKVLDEQTALEKAMTIVLLAEAGAHLISNGGALETEKLWSPVQLLIDNEINGMVGRILAGITVTEETLAVPAIEAAGTGGHFLGTRHTRDTWRREQFLPRLADRLAYERWQEAGAKDIVARAKDQARELLRTHQVPSLTEEQGRELDRIVQAAERVKRGTGPR
jgi:trimethylamine---corrinoid protein Co-methyltransferase